ncbi:hypothetical protein E4U35_002246 [Claviceps purpurea]|nr:hypothetical protein E4U35_002246 [Claviceps purpurea]
MLYISQVLWALALWSHALGTAAVVNSISYRWSLGGNSPIGDGGRRDIAEAAASRENVRIAPSGAFLDGVPNKFQTTRILQEPAAEATSSSGTNKESYEFRG